MSSNILTMINSLFGQGEIRQASAALGESESDFGKALRAGIPALLAGTMKKAASPGGATELFRAITGSGVDDSIGERIGQLTSNPDGLRQTLTTGESLVSNLFGNRTKDVTGAISQATGVKSSLTMKALTMAAPVIFGVLKKQVSRGGLNAEGLASFLGDQREAVLNTGVDDRVATAMGMGDLRQGPDSRPRGTVRAERPASRPRATEFSTYSPRGEERRKNKASWWPWAAAAAAAAIVIGILANIDRDRDEVRVAANSTRAGLMEPADTATLPANVYFDANQAVMDSTARETISTVADSARASGRSLAVTGFVGSSDDQRRVAKKAELVREALVLEGMDHEKIVVMPPEVDRQARDPEADRVQISALR